MQPARRPGPPTWTAATLALLLLAGTLWVPGLVAGNHASLNTPDLQVSVSWTPKLPGPKNVDDKDSTVTFEVTVTNVGARARMPSVLEGHTSKFGKLFERTIPPIAEHYGTHREVVTVPLTAQALGEHDVTFTVRPKDNGYHEAKPDDNTWNGKLVVSYMSERPDAQVGAIRMTPALVKRHDSVKVEVEVQNVGARDLPAGMKGVLRVMQPWSPPLLLFGVAGFKNTGPETVQSLPFTIGSSVPAGGATTVTVVVEKLADASVVNGRWNKPPPWLVVELDPGDEVPEVSEDNTKKNPPVWDESHAPDLAVTRIDVSPASPAAGEKVTFRVELANEGPAPVPPGVPVVIDFQRNVLHGQPLPAYVDAIQSTTGPDPLAPGARTTLGPFEWTFGEGANWIRVRAGLGEAYRYGPTVIYDPAVMFEPIANNELIWRYTPAARLDVAVNAIVINTPIPAVGRPFTGLIEVENVGGKASPAASMTVVLACPPGCGTPGTLKAGPDGHVRQEVAKLDVPALDGGKKARLPFSVTDPHTLLARLGAQVEATLVLKDDDDANNVHKHPIWTGDAWNLEPRLFLPDGLVPVGPGPVTVNVEIKNSGAPPPHGTFFAVRVTDLKGENPRTLLEPSSGLFELPAIPHGGAHEVQLRWDALSTDELVHAGPYILGTGPQASVVDPRVKAATFRPFGTYHDPAVRLKLVPELPKAGERYTVEIEVVNKGDRALPAGLPVTATWDDPPGSATLATGEPVQPGASTKLFLTRRATEHGEGLTKVVIQPKFDEGGEGKANNAATKAIAENRPSLGVSFEAKQGGYDVVVKNSGAAALKPATLELAAKGLPNPPGSPVDVPPLKAGETFVHRVTTGRTHPAGELVATLQPQERQQTAKGLSARVTIPASDPSGLTWKAGGVSFASSGCSAHVQNTGSVPTGPFDVHGRIGARTERATHPGIAPGETAGIDLMTPKSMEYGKECTVWLDDPADTRTAQPPRHVPAAGAMGALAALAIGALAPARGRRKP